MSLYTEMTDFATLQARATADNDVTAVEVYADLIAEIVKSELTEDHFLIYLKGYVSGLKSVSNFTHRSDIFEKIDEVLTKYSA